MKRKNSLKRNEEIAKIVNKRICYRNDVYCIYYKKTNQVNYGRVCISVSKKAGDAIVRNKIKRQIREMVTKLFDFTLPIDYVIVVRFNYQSNNFKDNFEKLEKLYLKINPNKNEERNK
ncbi:MAG: ribonuclease P protein component [Candidatus Caccosoma sp.]|nr:ribonuclease P protein component [Candidatus Caccosoma sp.]